MEEHKIIIYSILFIMVVVVFIVFFLLKKEGQRNPKAFATKKMYLRYYLVENIGYAILVISLAWMFLSNVLIDMEKESDQLVINKKLEMIWEYLLAEDDRDYMRKRIKENPDNYFLSNDKYKQQVEKTIQWTELQNFGKELKDQAKLSDSIRYILMALSTILIGVGRFGDVSRNINEIKNE